MSSNLPMVNKVLKSLHQKVGEQPFYIQTFFNGEIKFIT